MNSATAGRVQWRAEDGEPITVRVAGQGPAVILLHGWAASHRDWSGLIAHLGQQARLYCWDARGHGLGGKETRSAITVSRMATDLRHMIADLEIDRPLLVGHSMGALIILEYIANYGEQGLAGLCLVDQSPRLLSADDWRLGLYGEFDLTANAGLIRSLQEDFADAVLGLVAAGNQHLGHAVADLPPDQYALLRDYLGSLDHAAMIECWQSLVQCDFRSLLPAVRLPTLLIHGGQSQFYSLDVGRYLHSRLINSRFEIYHDSDHSPHLWERERFAGDLARLLRDTRVSTRS